MNLYQICAQKCCKLCYRICWNWLYITTTQPATTLFYIDRQADAWLAFSIIILCKHCKIKIIIFPHQTSVPYKIKIFCLNNKHQLKFWTCLSKVDIIIVFNMVGSLYIHCILKNNYLVNINATSNAFIRFEACTGQF